MPVIEYPIADAAIYKLSEEYMPLTIRDVNDAEGFRLVHDARMDVKARRVAIEKKRKELKADALEYGRKVDGEAKRLTALLEPIETHLEEQEDRYNAEKERIKCEAEEKRRGVIRERLERFAEVGCRIYSFDEVAEMTDAVFNGTLVYQAEVFRQQREKEAAEAEARRIEAEKLAAERVALEAERKRQAEAEAKLRAEQEKVEADKRRLAAEEAERKRQSELEQARKEAAERAKREALKEASRKEMEAKVRAAAEEIERKRIEALRPDSEKLASVADMVHAILVPEVSRDEDAMDARQIIVNELAKCEKTIRYTAEQLVKKG